MTTSPPSSTRQADPFPLVGALLAAVGVVLVLIAIWTTVYTQDGGGSATTYGVRDNRLFGGLVTHAWILLLIGAACGVVALVLLCLVVGLLVRSAVGRWVRRALERLLFEKIPGYRLAKAFTGEGPSSADDRPMRPALAAIEDAPGSYVKGRS